jgi:siroheme decarboxylase
MDMNRSASHLNSPSRRETRHSAVDRDLLAIIQQGLPLCPRPYAMVAETLGLDESEVIARIGRLLADDTIKRLGVVVRHRALGYRANAMVVWALPEARVAEVGRCLGRFPCVTLSYRRPARPPDWPYTLFTMIHGRDRATVLAQVEEIKQQCGLAEIDSAVLFSRRCFKQRGASYGERPSSTRAQPRRPSARARMEAQA